MASDNQVDNSGDAQNRDFTASGKFAPGNRWAQKPGAPSLNPGGRPRRKWLTDVVDEMLEEKLTNPADREAFKKAVWSKLLSERMVSAMTMDRVWERTEGKVADEVNVNLDANLTISDRLSKAKKRMGGE